MRKIIALSLGILLTVTGLYAQTARMSKTGQELEGGIKADVTFLNFLKSDALGAFSTLTPGGTIGGFMNIWLKDRIGIRSELNLNFKQTVVGWEQNNGRMQSFGIEIPIYVTGRFRIFANHHILLGIGPYTEFSCYARWMIGSREVDLLEIHESGEPMIQDTQSGFGAFLGYEFGSGLGINASYRICCYNILQPNTSQGVSMYPQSVSLGLAYKFGRK